MKIILLKSVKNIGKTGDIKNVSDGYAINFLFPQKLAQPANNKNINKLKSDQEKLVKEAKSDLLVAEKNAQKLEGMAIEIKGKCNEDGKLYAAITPSAIVKKIKEEGGVNLKVNQINMMEPIKDVGEHSVFIVLDHNLEAEITVIVSE